MPQAVRQVILALSAGKAVLASAPPAQLSQNFCAVFLKNGRLL
jgi:hypothetical protein